MLSLRGALDIPVKQFPVDPAAFVSHVVPLAVSYVVMAILAITPQTRLLRITLWPVVTLLAYRAAFLDWSFGKSERIFINGEFVRFIMCIPPHALSWALAKKPLVRRFRPTKSSPSIIMDALDLVTNIRGIGWDWSEGLYTPRESRPTNRFAFAFYTLFYAIATLSVDITFLRAIHTFIEKSGSGAQRTIFDSTLPFLTRYIRSSIITILAGFTAYFGLEATYALFTVFGVLLFGQDPAQWPPGLDKPWRSTSLTEFWGRRWHQWFRHTFIVCAYPFYALFGHTGRVVGAFLASGLAHHLILISYDRHSEMWRMMVGFGMMAPGMLAERAFYKLTGKKVGGILGWIWTVSWLVAWYNLVVEGFIKAGMYSHLSSANGWVENVVKGFEAWLHST